MTDHSLDADRYLERIGVDPPSIDRPDRRTLARLQRAHVRAVPFENLDIVGPPGGDAGPRIELSLPALYEKVVERERGGYCFELNGLFGWLLAELGYDVDRVPARVVSDGDASPPANHHTNLVQFDERVVADVGMGPPVLRGPLPLDGRERTDEAGVTWRIVPSDRLDETYRCEYRQPGDDGWTIRYVFSDRAVDLGYFRATNDYLQTSPESPFTDHPIVARATADGFVKLSGERLIERQGASESARPVANWTETLDEQFGLRYDRG